VLTRCGERISSLAAPAVAVRYANDSRLATESGLRHARAGLCARNNYLIIINDS